MTLKLNINCTVKLWYFILVVLVGNHKENKNEIPKVIPFSIFFFLNIQNS